MIDNYVDNPKSIKFYVKRYLKSIKNELTGKIVIDIPAGNGATSEILNDLGAKVESFDLFPEYFKLQNIECKRADIVDKIPLEKEYADVLICQEGIEHFSDQLKVFKEFNRILKNKGKLIVTTPSYSNLAAKFSYLLFESESNNKMPPNEIDDIWMSDKSIINTIYHGHIFLIGMQKLRMIAKLSGFKIDKILYTRVSKGSLLLFPIFYPLILLRSLLTYYNNMQKDKNLSKTRKKDVYMEQLRINISPSNLINRHIFVVFKKEIDCDDIDFRNDKLIVSFDMAT